MRSKKHFQFKGTLQEDTKMQTCGMAWMDILRDADKNWLICLILRLTFSSSTH